MKKYILSSLAVLSATLFTTSCNDMLDTDPRKTEVTDAVFPGKVADVEAELSATYAIMNTMGGGDSDNQNIWFWWEVMSDDCYGSGGLQDNKVKSLHHLVEMSVNQYAEPYKLLSPSTLGCPLSTIPRKDPFVVRGGRRKVLVSATLENKKENAYNTSLSLNFSRNLHLSSFTPQVPLGKGVQGNQGRRKTVGVLAMRASGKGCV